MAKLDTNQLAQALDKPNLSLAILLPENPTFDAVAAALALKIGFDKANRPAVVASSEPMTVEFHRLVGANNVSSDFGNRNLIISFPGQTEAVDKVSYNVESGELQLVVSPKSGATLDHTRLKFIPGSGAADVVVLVGVNDPSQLGKLYTQAREVVDTADQFVVSGNMLSQQALKVMQQLRLPIEGDAASNLLAGIEQATNHYQTMDTNADTFESAAFLLRQGAQRHDIAQPSQYPTGSIPTAQPVQDQPVTAQPVEPVQPDPDWYEPKIYRGTSVS